MTIEQSLYSYLSGYTALTDVVSTRIYQITKPQGVTLPCLTFQRVSTPRVFTHDTSGSTGTAYPRFQFTAYADDDPATTKQISDIVRAALNGKKGTIGSGGYAMTIQSALVQDERPDYDPETEIYSSQSDYIIWHTE